MLPAMNVGVRLPGYDGVSTAHTVYKRDDALGGNLLYHCALIVMSSISVFIGASVSEPLSSDLNVNFVCLSVCLSWMDRQLTVNHFRLLFCAFCVMR